MKFKATSIGGVFLIDLDLHEDDRGFFARSWCREEFAKAGLRADLAQCSVSYNKTRGTLRGLHYQAAPYEETKLVRCVRGKLFDVVVDLRAGSPTEGLWEAFELDAHNRRALYIPGGVAHGFQTLEDDTEIFYQMTDPFHAPSSRTVAWDDARFSIPWPIGNPILSDKDRDA